MEGMIIASYAIGCNLAFIYIRGEFYKETCLLEAVLAEAYDANLLGKGILGSDYDENSDINQDGILNIMDVVEIINNILN